MVNHGVRSWWHIQRLLIAWGLCREMYGPDVTNVDAAEMSGVVSRYYRDLSVFHEVFPDMEPGGLYERMRSARGGAVEDRVMTAPVSVLGVA